MQKQLNTLHLEKVIQNHSQDMTGKVVAITGTTSGTGYIAARELAKKGARVLLLNRESERSRSALIKLKEEVSNGDFKQIDCDLQSRESVQNAIDTIKEHCGVVDVLCNNAGVMALKDYATVDGYDVQMQTNVLSHFQLFKGLVPLLKKSAQARVVNHTSMARLGGPLEPKYFGQNGGDLGGDEMDPNINSGLSGGRWERYHQSKLANFVFTYAIKQKCAEKNINNIISVAAHPGLARTNLQFTTAESGGIEADSPFMLSNAQSAEDGATGILRGCMDINAKSGDFYGPQEWSGFPGELAPESELICQSNIDIFWEGCESAVGRAEL